MNIRMRFLCLLVAGLFSLLPGTAAAATLRVSVARTSVSAGETFVAAILVSSSDQPLNAVSGELSFPTNLLSVTAVSQTNSILTLWVQNPTYSNQDGTIDFSGVVPNPGWSGLGGQVIAVQFRAKSTGTATVEFASSAVLANDGNGTEILTSAQPATVIITAAPPAFTPVPPSKSPQVASSGAQTGTGTATTTALTPAASTAATTTVVMLTPAPFPIWTFVIATTLIALLSILLGLIIGARLRRHVRAATSLHRAHMILRRHFGDLKDALSEEITALERVRTRRSLTVEEERLINKVSKLLDTVEQEVEQDLFGK